MKIILIYLVSKNLSYSHQAQWEGCLKIQLFLAQMSPRINFSTLRRNLSKSQLRFSQSEFKIWDWGFGSLINTEKLIILEILEILVSRIKKKICPPHFVITYFVYFLRLKQKIYNTSYQKLRNSNFVDFIWGHRTTRPYDWYGDYFLCELLSIQNKISSQKSMG